VRSEEQIRRGQLICPTVGFRFVALGLKHALRSDRGVNAYLNAVLGLVTESCLKLFVDVLTAIDALSSRYG